jgi:hypothetical protein
MVSRRYRVTVDPAMEVGNNKSLQIAVEDPRQLLSLSEVKTDKKWIDGKDIFRKVLPTGALLNSSTKVVAHGISSIDTVVNLYGSVDNGSGTILRLPFTSTNALAQIAVTVSGDNINFGVGTDRTAFSGHLVIEYTK